MYGKQMKKVVEHIGTRAECSVKHHIYSFIRMVKVDPAMPDADILPLLQARSKRELKSPKYREDDSSDYESIQLSENEEADAIEEVLYWAHSD